MQQKQINCFGRLHSFIHYSLDWSRQTNSKRLPRNACKCINKNCVYLANSMAHPRRINTHTLTALGFKKTECKKKTINFSQSQQQSWKKCHKFTCKPNETNTIHFLELSILFVVYAIQLYIYSFINSF